MDDIYMEKMSVEKKLTNHVIVNKLHNMQWLRNTPHSSHFGKTKVICEQDNSNKTGVFSIKDNKENPIDESDDYCLKIDTSTRHSFTDAMSENNRITWNNDIDAVDISQTVRELDTERFEKEGILSTVVQTTVTAKLEAQCYIDDEQRNQANLSQNNIIENDMRYVACANISNSQKVDWDKRELDLKHSDNNNNYSKFSSPVESRILDTQKTILKMTDDRDIKASKGTQKKDRSNNKRVIFAKRLRGDIQWTDNTNQSKNIQFTGNNKSFDNVTQESAIIVSSEQPSRNKHLQQAVLQTKKQMSPRETDRRKFHNRHLSVGNTMPLSQIPNTFDTASYLRNVQTTSTDSNVMPMSMPPFKNATDSNKEYLNTLRTPNVQQKPVAIFSDSDHFTPCQINTWNLPMQEVGQFVNITQPISMCVYNPETYTPANFDNTRATNYLLSHPIVYTPSPYTQSPYTQIWNPQLQYSTPTFHNSPYYTTFPNIPNQSNNDITVGCMSICANDQQHEYVSYTQTSDLANTGSTKNVNYIKDPHNYNLNNYAVETRNTIDNIPMKSNRYCKNYRGNCRAVYDIPQRTTSISYLRSQQSSVPVGVDQCSVYCPPNQKQDVMNYVQISKNPEHESMQENLYEDDEVEDIPPIIFPKEFVTNNMNFSNETNQLATHVYKSNFKPSSQRWYS